MMFAIYFDIDKFRKLTMKTLCKNVTALSLLFLSLQFTPCYAANEAFHGTYSGDLRLTNEEEIIIIEDFSFTFGSDVARIGEEMYIFLPTDSDFGVYEMIDGDGDSVVASIIVRDRKVFLINIGKFYSDPSHGWADIIELAFTGNFEAIQLKGFEIDEDPNPLTNTGGEFRGTLWRVN